MSDKSNTNVRDSANAIKRSAEVAANETHRFSNACRRTSWTASTDTLLTRKQSQRQDAPVFVITPYRVCALGT